MANTNRFATASTTRLPLSDGDYIDVATRLSHGEREEMYARIAPTVGGGSQRREVRTQLVLAYLQGWSFVDADGQPVPYLPGMDRAERLALILNLDPDTFIEVHTAIDRHEDRMAAERKALKKTTDGAKGDEPTSPSASGTA